MLKEIVPTRQIPNEPRRVWFTDEVMDLIVWYAEDDGLLGFQLCDEKGSDEHALTWLRGKGFSYERVDDGEGRPGRYKMTPVLLSDGAPDKGNLVRHFRDRSAHVPWPLREFVLEKLNELNSG